MLSEKEYISESICQEIRHQRETKEGVAEQSHVLKYSIDELVKLNMRDLAQKRPIIYDERGMIEEAVELTEERLSGKLKKRDVDFNVRRLTEDARMKWGQVYC